MAKSPHQLCPRSAAARILADVLGQQRSLNTALANHLALVAEKDRGLCQQLCYGTLRWQPTLAFLSAKLLKKPFKNKDADIEALLLTGLYQLRQMRTPPHAAISETVNAAKKLGKQWAGSLLNACLRNYQRQQKSLEAAVKQSPCAQLAHPMWLLNRYQQDWPDHWQQIMQANNQQPPMMLRVNIQQSSRDSYLAKLDEQNIAAEPLPVGETGILLKQACDVFALPGFADGMVSVQDGSAQLVADLLAIEPGQRILDACAAPGGKTCHILEQAPSNTLVALDIDAERLKSIQQNTERLGLHATLLAADAADTDSWWDGQLFDRILIDAPCSGSGVIRRHPDIKLLRRADDIDTLAEKQRLLLDKLWPLLNANGLMVYTTCSAFKKENEQQIEAFLQRHPDAEEARPTTPPAEPRPYGYQRLPGDDVMDGFFYACLRRH